MYAKQTEWPLTPQNSCQGLAARDWPARLEKISDTPLIEIDGAHNPDGKNGLITALKQLLLQPITVIAGILADKDYAAMAEVLTAALQTVYLGSVPGTPRALPEAGYEALHEGRLKELWQEALAASLNDVPEEPIVKTGLLY